MDRKSLIRFDSIFQFFFEFIFRIFSIRRDFFFIRIMKISYHDNIIVINYYNLRFPF